MSKQISKKMLINVMHPEEARVAIVHDSRLMELNIEITGKEQTKGNIYKAVVLRVEPGLQAAFVDIGRAKPGFLQMGELHPDFWQWRDDVPEDQRKRRPRIQEVLRRGQELLVQVEKDERDNKGSALTTYISLPGRYMVIMPGSDSSGISRKVEQEGERKKLKEIVAGMNIPEGIGYIIRTEAVGRSPEELQKDFSNLMEQYEGIKLRAAEINGAGEVYRDSGLITRFIRDYFSDSIDEVLVDSKEAYSEAKEFFRENMPNCEKLVKLHKEKRPIFSRFQLEEQIDQIYEKKVTLPSGGYLIIEPTEALVSIDVNSGKTSGEKGVEDTAFKTNMEAAEEAARQLRLRDLGGLIVIDFIDMRDRKHNHDVEKTLKQALKMDKARVNLGRISEFGLLEMSRQRIAKTLNDAIHLACPHCEGRGKVKSVEAMALSFLRKVHAVAAKGNIAQVHGGLPLEVAYYLLNRKKRELIQIEKDYDIEVTVKGKTSFLLNQLELETVKREKTHAEDMAKAAPATPAAPLKSIEPVAELQIEVVDADDVIPAESVKKKKKRRKKKKPAGESAVSATTDAPVEIDDSTDQEEATPNEPAAIEADMAETQQVGAEPASKPKKRRRRRSKNKGDKAAESIESATTAAAEQTVEQIIETAPEPAENTVAPEAKEKPKRARKPRPKKAKAAEPPEQSTELAPTQTVTEPAADPEPAPEKAKKNRPPRVKKSPEKNKEAAEPIDTIVTTEVAQVAEAQPKKASRPQRKKAAAVE
jgi:ribonuclease E